MIKLSDGNNLSNYQNYSISAILTQYELWFALGDLA